MPPSALPLKIFYQKIPRWVSPLEAFTQPVLRTATMLASYDSLLNKDGTLKTNDDLKTQNIKLDWWTRAQLESRYSKDKQQGFYTERTAFDKILLQTNEKLIKKLYEMLLQIKMEYEVVK